MQKKIDTSWQDSSQWYDKIVGREGQYYHKAIILPKILSYVQTFGNSVLDLACGQGILGRSLPNPLAYTGIDLSKNLIDAAKQYDKNPLHRYLVGDITRPLPIKEKFDVSTLILAVQNIENPIEVFKNAATHLKEGGKFIIVMNHPYFRIPRQSSWEIDGSKKIQYRRINSYSTPHKIPIQTHPGKGKQSQITYSFHYPLSAYSYWLKEAGFKIELLEEWYSDKQSTGKHAKMENQARREFPLFLAIFGEKG